MTRENFSKANEIIAKIRKLEDKIHNLYASELKVNSCEESKTWGLFDIEISKGQLRNIIKYNRDVLKSQKEVLEKMLHNI